MSFSHASVVAAEVMPGWRIVDCLTSIVLSVILIATPQHPTVFPILPSLLLKTSKENPHHWFKKKILSVNRHVVPQFPTQSLLHDMCDGKVEHYMTVLQLLVVVYGGVFIFYHGKKLKIKIKNFLALCK